MFFLIIIRRPPMTHRLYSLCSYTTLFCSSYGAVGIAMYERHKTVPAVPSWLIVDSRYRARYRWGCGAYPSGRPPRDWIDSGYMIEAQSVADLASQCGIEKAALEPPSTEERRVGKGCVRTCRSRWAPHHDKKTKK